MKRREFIKIIGVGTVAWPIAARAQKAGKVYRLGILEAIPEVQNVTKLDALRNGLRNRDYREGQNLQRISVGGRLLRAVSGACCRARSPKGRSNRDQRHAGRADC
jgi:thioesterase domain-containing protein